MNIFNGQVVAFDLEIAKEIPDGSRWLDHRPLGISCAATLCSGDEWNFRYNH